MTTAETILIIIVLPTFALLLYYAIKAVKYLVIGATHTAAMALEYGILGLIILGVAWTFLLPFMIIACVIVGFGLSKKNNE